MQPAQLPPAQLPRLPAFAVVGETVVDLFDPGDGSACLARPGGSPLNVSIGLARLGNPTAFVGRLSRDPLGTVLLRHLERSGVDTAHLVRAAESSTMALVELTDGQARYEFSVEGTADFQWSPGEVAVLPAGAGAVHFGSLASWLPPGDEVVNERIAWLRATGSVLISYDPNARPALQGEAAAARAKVRRSAALAHVIKASVEDIGWLYGTDDPAPVVSDWLGQGAGLVVITDGSNGASAWVPGLPPVTRPAVPAQVADTVGAGDAFTSGLLDALARRGLATPRALARLARPSEPSGPSGPSEPTRRAESAKPPGGAEPSGTALLAAIVDDAALVAAITCGRIGADPPTRAEVDAFRAQLSGAPAPGA